MPVSGIEGVAELDARLWNAFAPGVAEYNECSVEEVTASMELGPKWRKLVNDVAKKFRRPTQLIDKGTSIQYAVYLFSKANQVADAK